RRLRLRARLPQPPRHGPVHPPRGLARQGRGAGRLARLAGRARLARRALVGGRGRSSRLGRAPVGARRRRRGPQDRPRTSGLGRDHGRAVRGPQAGPRGAGAVGVRPPRPGAPDRPRALRQGRDRPRGVRGAEAGAAGLAPAGEGYRVETAYDGARGLELWRAARPDLILLDIMLPGLDGLEFARRVRAESTVPIIMLTAR